MNHVTEINQYRLPAHTPILINTFGMHHNTNNWSKDGFELKPERWLDADNKLLFNKDVYLPFGTVW